MSSGILPKLLATYQSKIKESKEKCVHELDKMRYFLHAALSPFRTVPSLSRFHPTLLDMGIAELYRQSLNVLYLSANALYRNAFDNIRYILELMVQALYIDSRHPRAGMRTKIAILKEVEDKREYHAIRLIDELDIDHKDTLRKAYRELSKRIHPSHQDIIAPIEAFSKGKDFIPVAVDCEEVSRIYESTKTMFDIVWFLYISYLPKERTLRKKLLKNPDLIKCTKEYNLPLLSRALKAQLQKRKSM